MSKVSLFNGSIFRLLWTVTSMLLISAKSCWILSRKQTSLILSLISQRKYIFRSAAFLWLTFSIRTNCADFCEDDLGLILCVLSVRTCDRVKVITCWTEHPIYLEITCDYQICPSRSNLTSEAKIWNLKLQSRPLEISTSIFLLTL